MPRFGESLRRARLDAAEAIDVEERLGKAGRGLAIALSPASAELTPRSPRGAMRFLRSPEWIDRAAAAILIGLDSAPARVLVEGCIHLAFRDETPVVRGFALLSVDAFSSDNFASRLVRRTLDSLFAEQAKAFKSELGVDIAVEWAAHLSMLIKQERGSSQLKFVRAQRFAKLCGTDAPDLLRGQGTAARYLSHPDPDRRAAALQVIARAGTMGLWIADKVRSLVSSDPEPGVRIAAVGTLSAIYEASLDPTTETFLASIVVDESANVYLREIAYHALYKVHGVPVVDRPDTRAARQCPPRAFRFPKDMDRTFVERCLRSNE